MPKMLGEAMQEKANGLRHTVNVVTHLMSGIRYGQKKYLAVSSVCAGHVITLLGAVHGLNIIRRAEILLHKDLVQTSVWAG